MKVLVLFAHPRLSASVVQRALLGAIAGLDGVSLRDLYALYPDFAIDVAAEKDALLAHDLIVLQHPFYWYSCPAIVKEWLDLVLESGWAYGPGGTRLAGKFMLTAISTGGAGEVYGPDSRNRYDVGALLAPFNQTAHLCGMAYLEPFIIFAGRRLETSRLSAEAERYRDLIVGLRDGRLDPLTMLAKGYRLPGKFHAEAR